ncbi:MAG: zinc transport system permease protein [Myxococcota bacterium]|jgi:zinc transport system permease protein
MTLTWADFIAALPLFRDPILCAAVAGLALGYLGVFVVLRRMVFLTAVLTQASGMGVALGFFAGIHLGIEVPPALSAVGVALLVAAVLSVDVRRLSLSPESVLAAVWLACSAGAILLGDRITQEAHDIKAILFGTAVLVRPEDLTAVLAVSGVVLVVGIAWRRGLVFVGFDPDGARVQGLPVATLELTLMVLITLTVAVTTRALGALPVFAFSVLPAVAALMLTRRLSAVLVLAPILGLLSGVGGYMVAFFYSFPVGASQAGVAVALALLAAPVRLIRR